MADVARVGLSLAGAAVGFIFGGPLGASIGLSAGNLIGGAVFGEQQQQTFEGPRLNELSVSSSTYGKAIPLTYGTVPAAGNMIWATDIVEVRRTQRHGGGKKGGKGGGATSSTFEYFGNFAMAFSVGPVELVRKIWADGKLLVDLSDNTERGRIFKYGADKYRIYLGDETQLPDPLIQSFEGADKTSAHRGMVYVVFEGLPLADFGNRIPNIKAEIVNLSQANFAQTDYDITPAARDNTTLDYSSPHAVDFFGNDVTRFNRFNGAVTLGLDISTSQDFLDELTEQGRSTNIANGGIGRALVDPIFGDIYVGAEGTAVQGGGFAVFDKNGSFLLYQHQGQFSGMRNGIVAAVSQGLERLVVTTGGLDGEDLFTYKWTVNPLDPEGRGTFSDLLDTYTPTSTGADPTWWFAYDPTLGAERVWALRGTTASGDEPYEVVRIENDGTITVLGTVAGNTVLSGVSYDVNTDSLLILTTDAIYKVDPVSLSILDQIGDGVAASDGGNVGLGTLAFNTNLMQNQQVVQGIFHFIGDAEPGDSSGLSHNLVRVATDDLRILARHNDVDDFEPDGDFDGNGAFWDPLRVGLWTTNDGFRFYQFDSYATTPVTVGSIVADLCSRAGLDASQYDTSDLDTTVRGFSIENQVTSRSAIETLQRAYFFDASEIDFKIVFKERGASSVASVPFSEVAARTEGGSTEEAHVTQMRRQEVEVPRRVVVSYMLQENDYNIATQMEQRIQTRDDSPLAGITKSRQELELRLPIVLTDQEAREIASKSLGSAWVERSSVSFSLPPKWLRLDPSDVIDLEVVTPELTATLTVRLASVELGAGGVVRCSGVLQDTAVFSPNVEATTSPTFPADPIPFPVDTEAFLLNLPTLRGSVDDDGGAWFAAAPAWEAPAADWNGAILLRSVTSDGPFSDEATALDQTNWGVARSVLGTTERWTVFDDVNTIDVYAQSDAAPVSVSDITLFDGVNYLYIPETGELLQYGTATQIEDRTYRLSHLLRGRIGTENYIAQNSLNATVVFVDSDTMDRFSGLDERGLTRYYRPVTIGSVITDSAVRTFVNSSRSLLPLSPSYVQATRDGSNNLTVTWLRRTRYAGEWLDEVDVPLNENSERYEVDVVIPADADEGDVVLLAPLTANAADASDTGAQATLGAGAEIQSAVSKFGTGAAEFSPSGATDPSEAFISYADNAAFTIGTSEFTIEMWARFKDLTEDFQVLASHFLDTGDERAWLLRRNSGDLEFRAHDDGAAPADIVVTGSVSWAVDTWYHIAVTRDASGNVRLYVDGTHVGNGTYTGTIYDASTPVRLGKMRFTGAGGDQPFYGYMEQFRMTVGAARYTGVGGFTPPDEPFPVPGDLEVLRTLGPTSLETVTYSAAEQTTDGLTPGDPVDIIVYQISEAVGRGEGRAATV